MSATKSQQGSDAGPTPAQQLADALRTVRRERVAVVAFLTAGFPSRERFRDDLIAYYEATRDGHTPQSLANAFVMHQRFLETGDMRSLAAVR